MGRSRLRRADLEQPFRGVRLLRAAEDPVSNRHRAAQLRELVLIEALAQRLVEGQFFSHRSAALIWGAPMPSVAVPDLHLGVVAPARAPRVGGVHGHRIALDRCLPERRDGYPVSAAASTWAALGDLSLWRLVAAGDYLVRRYRGGWGRPDAGKKPITTIERLRRTVALGRWRGVAKLRRAVDLIREDAWSPRESLIRLILVQAGLPEPDLNIDVCDQRGRFLACLDLAYPEYRVAVEYHGEQHSATYARDIERVERLRAVGWVVIQVTKALAARPDELVRRVTAELRAKGWRNAG
ncbi:hypothetical protein J4H92_12610 [Leucobacter weissii]|uniref:DUF559 domain-containing protein n=1 Tax=Leucobacter weissii TaxID=1983706 RepID=A0A939SBA2_9MICO|nr:hypothetical protein [Leucobacter weissii]MBO1902787.1 hypothetical protein [Leucobacter weissii]